MKIGFIVDSSCGLSQKEANEKGLYYLPLSLSINGKEFQDGVSITSKEYYATVNIDDDVKTSATSPGISQEIIERASKENDYVIIYPISHELSSQYNSLKLLSEEFSNVEIVKSTLVLNAIVEQIDAAEAMNNNGSSIEEIMKFLNETQSNWRLEFIPKSLDWLVKGGRAKSSVVKLANLLKIIPIIQIKDGKVEKAGKGRIFHKTIINTVKSFSASSVNHKLILLLGKTEFNDPFVKEIKDNFEGNVELHYVPPILANHMGLETFSFITKTK